MEHRTDTAARPRLAMIAYLAIIVIPTLVFLALGLQSVRQKGEAIESLTASYARLSMERIADAFDRRVLELGTRALRDLELAEVLPLVSQAASPENQRAIRQIVGRVGGRHPVASRLMLQQGRTVRFPVTMWPLPESITGLLVAAEPRARSLFAAAFAEADRAEIEQGDAERAAAAYLRCADLAVPMRLKGIALARAARCYRKAQQMSAAVSTWQLVAERYGDDYDLFYQPYGLVANLALFELAGPAGARSHQARAAALMRDLAGGRWEVSVEQATYFLDRLREIEPRSAARSQAPFTPFLSHLMLAGVVERSFVPPGMLRAGELNQASLRLEDADYPFLYASLGADAGESSTVTAGLVIDPEWARTAVLPSISAENGVPDPPRLVPARAVPPDGHGAPRSIVDLRAAFSGWALVPSEGRSGLAFGSRDVLVFGGATTLVLGLLVLGVALLIRDVARQRELTYLRSDFVSGVSHQLRTPLTLIRLYSEMLTDYPDTSETERRERLDVITSESQRLTMLIDRVLDFSRIDHGQKPYVLERGDLAAAVRHVADVYAQYLRRRGFTVDVELEDGLHPVRFDADAVGDGVVNLMDNAAKYAGEGRYVLVRLVARGPDAVMLEVVDHGAGIPETERQRLFQPFYRGIHRKEKGGYGLGLFLVRHLMEAHGGRVEVDSELGRGSMFRLVFPVDRSTES
jgi:signal transduction histidine kinase